MTATSRMSHQASRRRRWCMAARVLTHGTPCIARTEVLVARCAHEHISYMDLCVGHSEDVRQAKVACAECAESGHDFLVVALSEAEQAELLACEDANDTGLQTCHDRAPDPSRRPVSRRAQLLRGAP